jgi:FkbM family methyltransferase
VTGYKLDNLTVLTENNAIGNVVIAGFWESDVIAALLAAEPQKLIMFEPDKSLYGAASANYANESNVEVLNATLSDKTGEAEYFVFTPNRFSSLLKPKQLLKIYRKNSNDNVIGINVSTVQSVCEHVKILPCAGNILLIGVNCPSSILSDAAQTDHLSYFDVIIVRQPKQGLYETEQQQETLSTVLQEDQFICVQEIAGDAMYTQFVYVRDHQREKMSALQAEVTQAETRNAAIAAQLAKAESRTSQFESSATELNAHYSKLKVQCEELTANVTALEIKGTELATQNTQLDAAVVKAKAQGENLSADVTQKQTTIEQMAAQIGTLQNKENGLVDSHKNKDTQIAELTTQCDQQAKGHQETKQQAESLKVQNDKLCADRAQKLADNEQLAAQVKAVQAKHTELAETQKNKDAKIADLTAQCDQQAKGNQEARQQAETLKAQNEKLTADRAQKLAENQQLAAQVKAVQAKHTELAETQKNKDTQIADLTTQRDQQAKGHQETKQQVDTLKAQNEKLTADRAHKLAENQQLAAQVKAVQAKHTELAETQKNKNTQIADLTTQRDQQDKGHQETKQQVDTLKAQNEKLSADRAQKLAENEQLAAQVKAVQAKHTELAETQKSKDTQITEMTVQLDQQTKGHQETRQQAESLKAQNEKLSADGTQKQTSIEQMAVQVTVLQEKQNELVEGHKNKDAQIVKVTEQRDEEAHWHQKNKKWAESLNKQCQELKVYSAERQKSADLALKLQTKAQVDLENLREKYQHKHINEQKLVALISELRAKLQQAATYYYELQEKHPELHEITQTQVEPSNIAEYQTANVAELDNKTRPAKRKKRGKKSKSVTRGKS